MVLQATIDMLIGMKMTAMAAELSSQLQDSSFNELVFEDRLGLLVTAKWNRRQTNTVKRLIHNAHFAATFAAVEEIFYYENRRQGQGADAALLHLQIYGRGPPYHPQRRFRQRQDLHYLRPVKRCLPPFQEGPLCRMSEFLDELSIARSGGELKKCLASYRKVYLLILDEWLIRPLSPQESYGLLEIVEAKANAL